MRHQQLFPAGAGTIDVDRGVEALLGHLAIEMDFEVAGALEFFVDHVVHAAAGVDQRRGQNRETTAFFDVARRAEETLGLLQRVGVHAAGEHLAGRGLHGVVGTRQAGDGIQQDDHVLLVLDQAFGALDHHFGDLHVPAGRFVEGGGDDFATHGTAHFRDFFRTLVDEQHEQHHVRVVGRNGVGDVLQHHGLTGLGRRDEEPPLALADGRDDVDDAAGEVFLGLDVAFELERLVGVQRREVLEQDLVLGGLGRLTVDLVELGHRRVTLAVLGRANLAFDLVAGVQVETTDLRRRHVDVVGVRQVRGFGRPQKAEAIRQHFQHAVAVDALAPLRQRFQDGENQLLLAKTVGVVDAERAREFEQFGNGLELEFGEVHGGKGLGWRAVRWHASRVDRLVHHGEIGRGGTAMRAGGAAGTPSGRGVRCCCQRKQSVGIWKGHRPWWLRRCRS